MLSRILNSRWTYYGPAALLAILALASQFQLRIPSRPEGGVEELHQLRQRDDTNVVFVVIDTLRADRLSTYGYARPTSPSLTELAKRSPDRIRVDVDEQGTLVYHFPQLVRLATQNTEHSQAAISEQAVFEATNTTGAPTRRSAR